MSYQVLARKWRPHRFKDVVGQAHVLTALENALEHNRLHHAYLFSGTRGVGKTTIGRLFAKGLNCETGITATPCGICNTCKEIDEGRFVDLLEIDAASRTKVEDTRELLDNVQYKPARGRFKVYLIDEVHMLSRHSFNALLKTLEEPPEYVKFLLATTDPQKLPVTILSRCLQFHLKHINVDQIHAQLDFVLQQEQVSSDSRALSLISHAAEGSMRDAMSLTDQAIALGNGVVNSDTVAAMLGTLDTDQALRLLEAMSSKQAQQTMNCLNELANIGVEWDGLIKELALQLHRVAMYQALPASLDNTQPDAGRIELLSRVLNPQDIQLCYQIALQGRKDLPFAPNGKSGVEMILLRMLAFRPVATVEFSPESIQVPSSEPVVQEPVQATSKAEHVTAAPIKTDVTPTLQSMATEEPSKADIEQQGNEYHEYAQAEQEAANREPTPPPPINTQSPVSAPMAGSTPANFGQSGALGALNQLRSRKKGLTRPGTAPKKGEATSVTTTASSAVERLAQKHPSSYVAQSSRTDISHGVDINVDAPQQGLAAHDNNDNSYQWKPTQPEVEVEKEQVTPTLLKQALEHEKTPEMIDLLVEESAQQDGWSSTVNRLNVAKLVQQLALNSAYQLQSSNEQGEQIMLILRSDQAHLNSEKAQQLLAEGISEVTGKPCQITVQLGGDGVTPLELRESLYQRKLQVAYQNLQADEHVNTMMERYAASIDNESVRPI
ncbi:DNA polymerase III subunit gamma/tau [Aliivibrio kagoshimensis]|uniref:DNA polymerase III subunit gamma/tau n=1 Tax=Aliivibrio kagoshimensis TaxID=2910230 RepID=UPI003D14B0DA